MKVRNILKIPKGIKTVQINKKVYLSHTIYLNKKKIQQNSRILTTKLNDLSETGLVKKESEVL